jgi:hypothetical protein
MRPATLALALLTTLAAGFIAVARRRPPATPRPAAGPAPSDLIGSRPGAGTGTESPNAAERLQQHLAGGPPAVQMSGSSSQQGPEPVATGLPDFTRGA